MTFVSFVVNTPLRFSVVKNRTSPALASWGHSRQATGMFRCGMITAAVFALLTGSAVAQQATEDDPTALAPERAIEVEAVVPIVHGDAAAARAQALERVFGEIVTIAGDAFAGIGSVEGRPALASRLRRQATDYIVAYQIVADTYRLASAAPEDEIETPAEPDAAMAAPVSTLPPGNYLIRVRGWVDEARLRAALGMEEDGRAADFALTLRAVAAAAEGFTDDRLARLRETVVEVLQRRGWRVAEAPDGLARHRLDLEVDAAPVNGGGGNGVAVRLTGRVTTAQGRLVGILQSAGEGGFSNVYFAWSEAGRNAATALADKLQPLVPPPARPAAGVARNVWVDVSFTPITRYELGLELEGAVRAQVAGIAEIQRVGYADRLFRLRLRFAEPLDALPGRLEAVHWRDFTLRVIPHSATELEVQVQRF